MATDADDWLAPICRHTLEIDVDTQPKSDEIILTWRTRHMAPLLSRLLDRFRCLVCEPQNKNESEIADAADRS